MRVKELLKGVDFLCKNRKLLDVELANISFDSRNIKDNSLFIAYKGTNYDSHKDLKRLKNEKKIKVFITEKKIEDVDSIIVEDGRKTLSLICKNFFVNNNEFKTIGITGTNGKTTTLYLIDHILNCAGLKTIRIGTVNYKIDDELFDADNTTPNPYDFYKFIGMGLEKGCKCVVTEVSSHALDQDRIYGLKFDYAVFTNLSGDHLDYHQDLESYFASKRKLFTEKYLKGVSVVNFDDDYGKKLINEQFDHISYAIENKKADVHIESYESSLSGSIFTVNLFGKTLTFKSMLVGKHNIYNILAAISVCSHFGIDNELLVKAIESFENVPGRLEKISWEGRYFFVDYAHTDDALRNVLESLLPFKKERIITVFGCGGDRDRTKRPRMGSVAEKYSDVVIITNDNPRSEDPEKIIDDIVEGINDKRKIHVIPDRREAIRKSIEISKPGDIILVAGKGHEDYQLINGVKYHFDDKEEILKCCGEYERA
ncbi:UDP-N-acetylmuramoyl-L-alanyl-D-glutamate--2,6-diaminopimelate ligase [Deferribacter autotrophicus]|uniref:UDP-N-acetylmuramoyl-L-alanyl-D-glutamate--2,6-diaminopimelate ligase n=1 Tax=Deferribacter autotrophicus TaxID=500465 RepID=A0A5A8F7K8_9BACT|nr:UDP-N-acetylmuramoyl-L-alanyl-D-glutamate--2,6-diaminopimelate ligase [Deferribacter autotrophicus]KAA0257856.1 UDP-N-acetylmuramoyl-L-alanyl-D-glutamate--2,6-diaminopimelate ligase [Deferribacter autotrophicus]